MTKSKYVVGDKPPAVTMDVGSGNWCSSLPTMRAAALKQYLQLLMMFDSIQLRAGPEAIAHMRHYLGNTGDDYLIDLNKYMQRAPALAYVHRDELKRAREFVETLPPGTHPITSAKASWHSFAEGDALYFAIGGYKYWGQGDAVVEHHPGLRRFALDFRFHFFDRYNWDTGKAVNFGKRKVRDSMLQELHRQCYAREFNVYGMTRTRVEWEYAVEVEAPRRTSPFEILGVK